MAPVLPNNPFTGNLTHYVSSTLILALIRMVQRLKKQHPVLSPSNLKQRRQLIINALDNDNNGTIEPEEFVQWVLKGAKKTRAGVRGLQREEFKVLAQFLESYSIR